MADQIEISNVGQGGVASEVTLQRLVAAMNALAIAQGKPKKQNEKAQEAYKKALKLSTIELKNNANILEEHSSVVEASKKAFKNIGSFLITSVSGALGALVGSTVNMGKELVIGGDRLSDFTQHLPILGSTITDFTKLLEESADSLRGLTGVGASFNNNFKELIKNVLEAEMPFDDFAQTVLNNSQAMAALGTTVTGGTMRFAEISKELRTGDVGRSLFNMGFTVTDINEGLARYTLLQARSGRLQKLNSDQLIEGTGRYLKEIDALAKVTGMQRDEIMDSMLQQQTDAQIRAVEREIEARGGNVEAFRNQIALLEKLGPELNGMFRQLIDGIPDDEMGAALIAATDGQAAVMMQQVRAGTITVQEFYDGLKELGPQIENAFGDADLIGGLRRYGHSMSGVLDNVYNLLELQDKTLEQALGEQRMADTTTSILFQFSQAINSLKSKVLLPLINEFFPVFDKFMKDTFSDANMQTFVTNLTTFMKEFAEDPKGKFSEIFDSVKTEFKILFKNLEPPITKALSGMLKHMMDEIIVYIGENTIFFNDAAEEIKQARENQKVIDAAKPEEVEAARKKTQEEGVITNPTPLEAAVQAQELSNPSVATDRAFLAASLNEMLKKYNAAENTAMSGIANPHRGALVKYIQDWKKTNGSFADLPQEIQNAFPNDLKFAKGTNGFRDFGKGTLAMLHGREAVVPEDSPQGKKLTQDSNNITVNQEATISAINHLNTTMNQAISILNEIKQLNKRQLGATENLGNVY